MWSLQRRFGNFDMRYVHPRVRGIGNPMDHPAWYWNGDLKKLSFSLVPHPQPVPAEMVDPGETCMQVKATAGEQSISQIVFIGTKIPKESLWYGQLEPGKDYHLEVWLRQEGLGNDGEGQVLLWQCVSPGRPDVHRGRHVEEVHLRLHRLRAARGPVAFRSPVHFHGPGHALDGQLPHLAAATGPRMPRNCTCPTPRCSRSF